MHLNCTAPPGINCEAMIDFEREARLRELREQASKEGNSAKLLELVRQINDLMEHKTKKAQTDEEPTSA